MAGLKMDRSVNLNLLHSKMSYLRQYKKIDMCCCAVVEKPICIEHFDNWSVKDLPENWVPVTAPSKVIAELNESKEKRHNATLEEMYKDMLTCSESISKAIRLASDEFRLELNACIEAVKIESYRLHKLSQVEYNEQSPKSWENIVEVLRNLNLSLNEFYKTLNEMERQRSGQCKQILSNYSYKICKIAHMTPFQVEEFFEMMILKVNQNLLTNASVRNDLYNHLHYLIYIMGRDYQKHLKSISRYWEDFDNKTRTEQRIALPSYPEDSGEGHDIPNMQAWMSQLEGYITNMSDILKSTIAQVFQLHQIGKLPILKILILKPQYCFQECFFDISSPGSFCKINLGNIYTCMSQVRNFIEGIFDLWKLYSEKNNEKREQIKQDLQKKYDTFDKTYQQKLQKITPMVTVLRKETTLKKLQKSYRKARKSISALDKLCQSELDKELSIVNSYDRFMNEEIEILIEKSKEMLEIHKKDNKEPIFDPNFPDDFGAFRYKVICLVHWKQGLYSAVQTLVEKDKYLLEKSAAESSESFMEDVKAHSESYRSYLRILNLDLESDFETRKFELKLHASRLKEHSKGIKANIKNMKKGLKKTPADAKSLYKEECLYKVRALQKSNKKFNDDLKNFDDGGNYTADEAKKMAKTLLKNDKTLGKEESKWVGMKIKEKESATKGHKKTKRAAKGK